MKLRRRGVRLAATVLGAITALSPIAVLAQSLAPPVAGSPPGGASAQPGEAAEATVPDRVGRLSKLQGSVSWHAPDAEHWDTATSNLPVTEGDAFWTQPDARAQLEISANAIVLNGATEVDIDELSGQGFVASVPQGGVLIRLVSLGQNESWTVLTPRGLVRFVSAGCYAIAAGDTEQPTEVSVIDGAAEIDGANVGLQVGKSQTATIEGAEQFTGRVDALWADDFVRDAAAFCQPAVPQGMAPPAAVLSMPGGSDLAAYGTWGEVPEYGPVWYPPVELSWVPYQQGTWGYVGAWGWTWIDAEPWGFVPFHYGRWARLGGRWAWLPGAFGAAWHPTYAPALVSFFEATGLIAWAPLGPHEPYFPWFHAGPAFIRAVNGPYVADVDEVVRRYEDRSYVRDVAIERLANRDAITAMQAAAMASSHPAAGAAQPIAADRFADFRPVFERLPVLPAVGAVGLTASLATRLHLPGGAAAMAAARLPAPGPQFRPGLGRAVSPIVLRPPAPAVPTARPGPAAAGFGPPSSSAFRAPALPPYAPPAERDRADVPGLRAVPTPPWPSAPSPPRAVYRVAPLYAPAPPPHSGLRRTEP
ncbi:MAG TPA: DUF6600 domain-containing protein [Acetobacteraceae bacterium]|nr:DUF6600 domain-containing protein [Acetobacteraceae bacterium]